MSSLKRLACAASIALLVACGGGGGEVGTADEAVEPVDTDEASIILALAMYDSMAGLKRMVKLDGYTRIKGTAPLATTACPGGGSIQTEKVGATFTLVASNCRLLSTDGLVYNGTWVLNIFANSYAADGSCADTCQFNASINHAAARFGYGTATETVFGTGFQIQTIGVETAVVFSMAENLPGAIGVNYLGRVGGDGAAASATLRLSQSGIDFLAVDSTDDRMSLLVSGFLRANVLIGPTGLAAAIDKDMNGSFEKTLIIPWARLQE